jgi:hypothetical protein
MCLWLYTGCELITEFTAFLWLVTTNNYNTLTGLHALQITVAHTESSVCSVFTGNCLVAASNSGDSSASVLTANHQLQLWTQNC